ncbi:hypothetical protein [Burkholderia sp. LMU1-1-1.1]|uniref:hypothetical protein n=1 Tax=Burkholderia sp. LMU1-1-1.1 TaxID=3135266 RepID=UPI003443C8E1
MRKVLSVLCHIVAGFLFNIVSVLAFISALPATAKFLMLAGFSLPALIALVVGLAFTGFRDWKRDAGIVLLSTSAWSAFMVLTMACLLMSEEFTRLVPQSASAPMDDYLTGGLFIIVLAIGGWLLFKGGEPAGRGAAAGMK